jgi:hypothetical protein
LRDLHDEPARYVDILADHAGKWPTRRNRREVPCLRGQIAWRRDGVDSGELGLDRCSAQRIEPALVHHAGVEVRDLLRRAAGWALRRRGDLIDDRAHLGLRAIRQLDEGPVADAIGWDDHRGKPCAVDVREQIVLRTNAAIERPGVEARCRRTGLRSQHDRRERQCYEGAGATS